jgi:hypothetical protein
MDALLCNNCGARLEIAATTKFATCARCNTVLQIKRTDSAWFTDVLGPAAPDASTEITERNSPAPRKNKASRRVLPDVDVALEEELNAIDREWTVERDHHVLSSEFGGKQIPSKGRGLFAGGVLVVLAIALFFMFRTLPSGMMQEMGPYLSGFILLFGVGLGWFQYSKGVDYDRAFAAYQARRNAAIAKYRH